MTESFAVDQAAQAAAADRPDEALTGLGTPGCADAPAEPAEPADLIHGDPASIREAAAQLRGFAAAFAQTAEGMTGIGAARWRGPAAEAFPASRQLQPGRWQTTRTACADAAQALDGYAQAVASAQDEAGRAIAIYAGGGHAQAQAVLASARRQRDAAARRAAAEIQAATSLHAGRAVTVPAGG